MMAPSQPWPPVATHRSVGGLLLVAAVTAMALIAILATITFRQQGRIADLVAQNRDLIEVITAPDARFGVVQSQGFSASVVSSRERDIAIFASSDLPDLPESQGYELWLMGPGGPRPAAMLGSANDRVQPAVITGLGDATDIGLTIEPAAGSTKPTTQPIMMASLPM